MVYSSGKFLSFVAVMILLIVVAPVGAQQLQSPDWQVFIDDYGYSNLATVTFPGVPAHEILTGNWAGAVRYDGINTANGNSMVIPPNFFRPSFQTNSTFQVLTPIVTVHNPANNVPGLNSGSLRIRNEKVLIEIQVDMKEVPGGMAIGLNPGGAGDRDPLRTSPYVLFQTYRIRNISTAALTNFSFFQFLHSHPNNDLGANSLGIYDPTHYPEGGLADYRFDVTTYGPSLFSAEGSDLVGFSANMEPTTFGIGEFGGSTGQPPKALLADLYAGNLPGTTSAGPTEIAGAMEWELGALAPNQIVSVTVALWVGRAAVFTPPEPPIPPKPIPPAGFQAYPGDSNGASTNYMGYKGKYGDTIAAVPGVLSIVPGDKWANFVTAAQVGVDYGIKNVSMIKQTPNVAQCADVFPARRIAQQGTANTRIWWPIMYELPGTTWTLTITYGTNQPWDDDGPGPHGPSYFHSDTWEWRMDASLESMRNLLVLFHELPFGLDEVPLISDEVLYPQLLQSIDAVIANYVAGDLVNAGFGLGDFEMTVMDACIASSPAKPWPKGPGTGIANSDENPACCKIMVDAEYIGRELGLFSFTSK